MLKKMIALSMSIGLAVAIGAMWRQTPVIADNSKITICHRTNAANNPYRAIEVAKSAVDGNKKSDHTLHTGPLASSYDVARDLKARHIEWGDIIPAFDSYSGYNLGGGGQAILDNNCTWPTKPGQPKAAMLDYTLECDVEGRQAVISFTNTGNADGTAIVNGTNLTVPAAGEITQNIPTDELGTKITIKIDDTTVFDQLVSCEPGRGGGGEDTPPGTTPSTPSTTAPRTPASQAPASTAEIATLPYTAGDTTKALALTASAVAAIAAVASVAVKTVLLRRL